MWVSLKTGLYLSSVVTVSRLSQSQPFFCCLLKTCIFYRQSKPVAVSRGVSQPDPVKEDPPDLFSEEEEEDASNTNTKSNGVHSDDDNDLFAGKKTCICPFDDIDINDKTHLMQTQSVIH